MWLSDSVHGYIPVTGAPAEKVGQEAGDMLINNLFNGGCVDEFLQDQVRFL